VRLRPHCQHVSEANEYAVNHTHRLYPRTHWYAENALVYICYIYTYIYIYIYIPTASGKPATMPSPGCVCVCVCAHALSVCVCVCVCVFVCPHVLGRCSDASCHRCIRRVTNSNDASIHSSIHQCIQCVRCGSFDILLRYFSICCAVVLLISGWVLVSFCQSRGPF
jgi:hypothetical protein